MTMKRTFVEDSPSTPLLERRSNTTRGRFSTETIVALALGTLGCVALAGWATGSATFGDGEWKPRDGRTFLAPAPTNPVPSRTFMLHTQCLDRATKLAYAEFFYTGAPEAYIVRHEYGSHSFFKENQAEAIAMERVVLPTQERAWQITAPVGFEYGFAFRNAVTGEWKREIGGADSLLAQQPCTQKYGEYFNRVVTLEKSTGTIEYIYGSCNSTCPPGFTESQWVDQPLTGDVPSIGVGLDLGEGDDARLITIRTGLPIKGDGYGPAGRGLIVRDTRYAETEDRSRWILAIVDPYTSDEMKLALLEVNKDANNRLIIKQIDSGIYPFGHTCVRTECAVATYDIPSIWHDHTLETFPYTFEVSALQYSIARKGDTKAPAFEKRFPDSAFISTTNIWTIQEAGTWGRDIDVRRVVFTSGGLCGSSFNGQCLRMAVLERAYFQTNTADEAYWIATLGGGGKGAMALIKVYVDAQKNLLAKIDSAREGAQCPSPPGDIYTKDWHRKWDILKCDVALATRWSDASVKTVKSSATDDNVVGIGALAYILAPEMTQSLASAFDAPS